MSKSRETADSVNPQSISGDRLEDGAVDSLQLAVGAVETTNLADDIEVQADNVKYNWGITQTVTPTQDRSAYDKIKEGVVSVKDFGAKGDGTTDDTAAIQAALSVGGARTVYFPPGNYKITSTLQKLTQTVIMGPTPTATGTLGAVAVIRAFKEDLGVGVPMIRCSFQNGNSTCHRFVNIQFVGDLEREPGAFFPANDQGVSGIDVSGAKQGVEFHNCTFTALREAVLQDTAWTTNYVDMVSYMNCYFASCYTPITHNSTVGMNLQYCYFEECWDWIDTTTNVYLDACRFQCSDFTQEFTRIKAAKITAINCWLEGGNRWFSPSQAAIIDNCTFSVAKSALGFTRFISRPQNDGVYLEFRGTKRGEFERLVDLGDVTDPSTITLIHDGVRGGLAFGNTASFAPSIESTNIGYWGHGCYGDDLSNLIKLRYNTKREKGPLLMGEMGTDKSGMRIRGITQPCRTPFRPGGTWDNNRNFTIEIYYPYNADGNGSEYNAFLKLLLIGDDFGSGGTNGYSAECLIHKAYDTNWIASFTGKDPTAWTVTFSSQTITSVDVEISINHPGTSSNNALFLLSSSEGVEIVHP